MKPNQEEKLIESVKATLDRSVQEIDADTRYKLQQARNNVLRSSEGVKPWYASQTAWIKIGALACVPLLAVSLMFNLSHYDFHKTDTISESDILIYELDEGTELYEQYEFYVWLTDQEISS